MEARRIRFETNVDETVDAYERYWKRARAGQSQRQRGVLQIGAASILAFFTTIFVMSDARVTAAVPMLALSVALGALCWPIFGRLYDRGFTRRLRRAVIAQMGDEKTWLCEVELRNEGVWTRSRGVELLIHWKELALLEDSTDAVEFHFRDGFVIARNRAFRAPADRLAFMESARGLAAVR